MGDSRNNTQTNVDRDVAYDRNASVHRAGMDPTQVATYYSDWANNYEQDLCEGVYNGPIIAARELAAIYPKHREHVKILDVAAGTGFLGKKLHELGFRELSALDPAQGMLDVCKSKGIYREFICEFMTGDRLPIPDDSYDCIAVSGGMGESHLPRTALSEMVRIVKPGGHVCIVMRQEYLQVVPDYNDGKLESTMQELVESGKWKQVTQKRVKNYSFQKDGMVFVYQVK